MTVLCDYCQRPARLTNGAELYPHRADLANKRFWICQDCRAWVGCHAGTTTPFGRLANHVLRRAKRDAHEAFDRLWANGRMSRKEAYRRLADLLGLTVEETHIGKFDVELCRRVVAIVRTIEKGIA